MLAAALSILGFPVMLWAGAPYEELDAGDVFVATVTRVEDEGTTNARPPRVWLEVQEVLRGEADIARLLARSPAVWSPRFHGIDWVGGHEQALEQWGAKRLKGPRVGQKFILGGRTLERPRGEKDGPAYDLFAFVRIPYSDLARGKVIARLAALDAARRQRAAERAAEEKQREQRGGE